MEMHEIIAVTMMAIYCLLVLGPVLYDIYRG